MVPHAPSIKIVLLGDPDCFDPLRAEDFTRLLGWDVSGVHCQPDSLQPVSASQRQQQPTTSRGVPVTAKSPLHVVSNVTSIAQCDRRPDPQPNTPHPKRPARMAHLKLVRGHMASHRVRRHRPHQHQLQVSIAEPARSKKSESPLHHVVEQRDFSRVATKRKPTNRNRKLQRR
jgi:hypothetical protein